MKKVKSHHNEQEKKHPKGSSQIRPDLQDASQGKDLSYLSEMPQMGRDEGVKAGVPPPKETNKNPDPKKK